MVVSYHLTRAYVLAVILCLKVAQIDCHKNFGTGKVSTATVCGRLSAFGLNEIVTGLRGGEVIHGSTAEDVDAVILKAGSSQQLVVIDFTASWCGPCRQIAPVFKELSESVPDVVFVKVDVDENPDTAAKYSVSAMPTFIFLKNGVVVDRLMGANPARLEELIKEHM